jgi:hypothetical protein
MPGTSTMSVILILWGIVTAGLVTLLIYRSLIAMKEDDQLFLTHGEAMEREQAEIQVRLRRIAPYAKMLGAVSGLLLFVAAGLWVYQQFNKPMFLP